ncbi:hypothetical protein C0993_004755, partial [Termitomyces sp. T159_Od127]
MYDIDNAGVTAMVSGNLMPWPLAILPSILSVTFIGIEDLPKRWLYSTCWIQKHVVFEALQWLKNYNTKYYEDIVIDGEHIQALPEDNVPVEITSIVHQSEDTEIINQESADYVSDDQIDNQ